MITLLTILHISVCVFLIGIVLLQHGKGADMGASFGGGGGQTVFGSEGPLPLLNKITTTGAIVFMITSVALAYNSAHMTKGSVMKGVKIVAPAPKPLINKGPIEIPLPSQKTTAKPADKNAAKPAAEFPGESAGASHKGDQKPSAQTSKESKKTSKMPAAAKEK